MQHPSIKGIAQFDPYYGVKKKLQRAKSMLDAGSTRGEVAEALNVTESVVAYWIAHHLDEPERLVSPLLPEFRPKPSRESTGAPIGSSERIAIYRERAERGEELYHAADTSMRAEEAHLLGRKRRQK